MNDYDELIEAHAFAKRYGIHIIYGYTDQESGNWIAPFTNPTDLLVQLKKVAGVPDRFKIGQEVWFINAKDQPQKDVVADIDSCSREKYFINDAQTWMAEDEIFPSKLYLIDVQLKHWMMQKEMMMADSHIEDAKKYYEGFGYKKSCTENEDSLTRDDCHVKETQECVHEDDGNCYDSQPAQTRCRKCGEFYR